MGECRRIEQDEVHTFAARGMDALDQFVLGVGLQVQQMMAGVAGALLEILVDLRQRHRPVDARFAGAEQIQVRAMKDQKGRHVCSLLFYGLCVRGSPGSAKGKTMHEAWPDCPVMSRSA